MFNKFVLFLLSGITVIAYSQTSLYSGINPYAKRLQTGDIIRVHVNNNFLMSISGEYNQNFEVKLKLIPDNKNITFLKQSELSRVNQRKNKEKQSVSEKFDFIMPVRVTVQDNGDISLNGSSLIQVNGKNSQVTLSGTTRYQLVQNNTVKAADIVDLNLQVSTRPILPRDRSFNVPEDAQPGQEFTEEETRKYINQYLQEVLGGLQ